jgi:hypothetical protein
MVLQNVMAQGKRASMQVEAAFECRRGVEDTQPPVRVQLENA